MNTSGISVLRQYCFVMGRPLVTHVPPYGDHCHDVTHSHCAVMPALITIDHHSSSKSPNIVDLNFKEIDQAYNIVESTSCFNEVL